MGVFRQFPYSNFHEMNMDEMIKIIKNMLEEWAQYYAEWDAWMNQMNEDWSNYQEVMNEAWQNMQDFINNYFDNLDVQDEINNKISSMVQTGEFGTIVAPFIPSSVTEWLTAHITEPVGVVIDTSLSVEGACADAKATGKVKSDLENATIYTPSYPNNGYIHKDTGEVNSQVNYLCTDFIPLNGSYLRMNQPFADNAGVAFYDETKSYISGHGRGTAVATDVADITVPSGAVYFRTCRSLIEPYSTITPIIYKSNVNTVYDNLNETFSNRITCFDEIGGTDQYIDDVRVYHCNDRFLISNIRNDYDDFTGARIYEANDDGSRIIGGFEIDIPFESSKGSITYNSAILCIAFKYNIENLASGTRFGHVGLDALVSKSVYRDVPDIIKLDTGGLIPGYIKYSDGSENTHATFKCTGYVECKGGSTLSVKQTYSDAAGIAFYDEDFNFVAGYPKSGADGSYINITVPDTAKYFRVSVAVRSGYTDAEVYVMGDNNDIVDDNPLHHLIENGGYTAIFRNIGAIGDSLASGHVVWDGGSQDIYDISWGQFMARACGNTVHNFSVGGLTTKTWYDTYGNNPTFTDNLCTGYIIGLNQNDFNTHVPVGSPSDIDLEDYTQNANTFYGNYAKIIQRIKELQPRARIFVLTNPRLYGSADASYNDPIRWMAENFEYVYLLDLFNYGEDLYTDDAIGDMWYGGHLTETGYYQAFIYISTFIDWYIRNNMDEFKDVQFIGTNREIRG